MAGSIRLHPQHGLNPTVPQCFWCGKDKGEVALLGAAYKGEAPMHMILDYEPCDECKANMAKGITFIECEPYDPTRPRPELVKGSRAFPTGRWSVVKEEAVRDMPLTPDSLKEHILKAKKAFLEKAVYEMLIVPAAEKTEEKDVPAG